MTNEEQLALNMASILEYQKNLESAYADLVRAQEADEEQLGSDKILRIQDVRIASEYDERVNRAQRVVDSNEHKMTQVKKSFLDSLPGRIVYLMQEQQYVLTAKWITQDSRQLKYGPYAAYFYMGELVIERFENLDEFKSEMDAVRINETNMKKGLAKKENIS